MHFTHHPRIWQDFPQLSATSFILEGVSTKPNVDTKVGEYFERARARLQNSSEAEMPEITAWRQAYSDMGLKPTKYRCAAESLLRRFRKEDDLPRFHPLIDVCNALSVAFAIPIAVFDLDKVNESLEVRYAEGDERYLDFSGETQNPEKEEIIFSDSAKHAHSRRWCFRQSKESVVTPQTSRALIISEAMHEEAQKDIQTLSEELKNIFMELWSAPTHHKILSESNPLLEF